MGVESGDLLELDAARLAELVDLGAEISELSLALDDHLFSLGQVRRPLLEGCLPLCDPLGRRIHLDPTVLQGRLFAVAICIGLGAGLILRSSEQTLRLATRLGDEILRRRRRAPETPPLHRAAEGQAEDERDRSGRQADHRGDHVSSSRTRGMRRAEPLRPGAHTSSETGRRARLSRAPQSMSSPSPCR